MFIKLLYKQATDLVVRFSALIRLLALCLFIDISIFSQGVCFKNLRL